MRPLRHLGRVALMAGAVTVAAVAPVPAHAEGDVGFHYPTSWVELQKMKPMEVMHMMDSDKSGYVTKEEFLKFQEEVFNKMDREKTGKVTAEEWMGHKPAKMETKETKETTKDK